MSSGGAFWIIGVAWVVIAGFYYGIAEYIGRYTRTENDGCLMGLMNIILTIVGGAAGLLALRTQYPTFVFSSLFGALILPTLGTLFILSRMKRKGVGKR